MPPISKPTRAPVPAASAAAERTGAPSPRWLHLPRFAWRLLARHWPVLAFWFFAQQLTGMILLRVAVTMGSVNHLLGFLGLAVLVVAQLLCTIAMFDALRSALPGVAAAGAGDGLDGAHAAARFGAILAVALLPFFAYYASWGLVGDTIRAYKFAYLVDSPVAREGLPTDLLHARGLWLSVVSTWLLRQWLIARLRRAPSVLWSVLSTICQAYWVFIGLYVLKSWSDGAWDWFGHRMFWTWLGFAPHAGDAAAVLTVSGPSFAKAAFDDVGNLVNAILLPLAWFAIAAIVYGRAGVQAAWLPGEARVDSVRRRFSALPLPLRHGIDKLIGTLSDGWNSKAVPVARSLRVLLGAGVAPALLLCVCYVALDVLCSLAWRGMAILIGAHDAHAWDVFGQPLTILFAAPLGFHPSLLAEPARICLLAAAVDLALRRVRRDQLAPRVGDAANAGDPATATTQ